MCIGIRASGGVQRPERPLDGDQVADHLDGLDGRLVGIGPASDLVEVVAETRQRANSRVRSRSTSACATVQGRARPNRPPHEIRQRQACRARLGVPRGTLRLAGADLHPDAASGAHYAPLPLWGSEGARPPASPFRGRTECGHRG